MSNGVTYCVRDYVGLRREDRGRTGKEEGRNHCTECNQEERSGVGWWVWTDGRGIHVDFGRDGWDEGGTEKYLG